MSRSDYLVGSVFLAGTLTAVGAAAWFVLRRRLAHLAGAARWTALGLLACGLLTAVHLVPGALGVLSRETVLAAAGVAALGAWRLAAAPSEPEAPRPNPASGRASWVIAGFAAGLVGLYTVASAVVNADVPTVTIDMVSFHLPGVARWIQEGSLWQVHDYVPDWPFGYYPGNGDLLLLGAIQPFDSDFLVRLVSLPLLGLTALGTYSIGRELGAPAASAVLAASALLAVPIVTFIALEGLPDTFMLATFAGGVAFAVRHTRTRERSDLVLAALGLGLALGAKWYALPAVAVVVAVWALTWRSARRRPTRPGRDALVALSVIAAGGGFWLVRNLVESGNPFFPQKVSVLGVTLLDAPRHDVRELYGSTVADYLFDGRIWDDYFLPAVQSLLTLAALALALAAMAAVVSALRGDGRGERDRVLMLAACSALIALAYIFLPFSAQGPDGQPVDTGANLRYLVPALALAAPLAAWAAGRLGSRARLVLELVLLAGVIDAVVRTFDVPNGSVAKTALVLAVGALGAVGIARVLTPLSTRRRVLAGGSVALVAAVGVAAVGWVDQRAFNDDRYRGVDPAGDWLLDNAGADRRIATAGIGFNPVIWLSFGPRIENEVEYVGPRKEGMLRPYTRRAEFQGALRRGDYDALVVLLAGAIRGGLSGRQEKWVTDAGWREVARGGFTRVYVPPATLRGSLTRRGEP